MTWAFRKPLGPNTITLGNGAGDVVGYSRGRDGNITLGNGAGNSVSISGYGPNTITLATAPMTR